MSFPFTPLGWHITHLSPPQSPKATKYTTKITRFALAFFFRVQRGTASSKLSNFKSFWFVLPHHPSRVAHHPSITPLGWHITPLSLPQSPKATKSTTKIPWFASAFLFGQQPQQGTKSCRMGRNSVHPSVHPPTGPPGRPSGPSGRPSIPSGRPSNPSDRP